MSEDWDRILAGVLRPARSELDGCKRALDEYAAARADFAQSRMRVLSEIEARLSAARAKVFAAGTGVVSADMTALEREWLTASRETSPELDLERLWQRVSPERWRSRRMPDSAEAIVTLASDPDGVDEAERTVSELSLALASWGVTVGARVDWCVARELTFAIRSEELFSAPASALTAVATHVETQAAHRRRLAIRDRVQDASAPTRNSSVARELAFLAFASALWDAAKDRLPDRADAIGPALRLWRLGYALTAADPSGVVLTALPA